MRWLQSVKNMSIFYKILITPLLLVVGYTLYLIYATYVNLTNSQTLSQVEQIDYPILELI